MVFGNQPATIPREEDGRGGVEKHVDDGVGEVVEAQIVDYERKEQVGEDEDEHPYEAVLGAPVWGVGLGVGRAPEEQDGDKGHEQTHLENVREAVYGQLRSRHSLGS